MELKIYENSTNYTCQVIKLPIKQIIQGLDNLVAVTVQGNQCLISKDSSEDELYLFFPAESQLSDIFLSANNLYRHAENNNDKSKKGFFEDNRRVKALKFKGIISSGFVIPLKSLEGIITDYDKLKVGEEFNSINTIEICKKYTKKEKGQTGFSNPRTKVLDNIIDSKFAPEHPDTSHLMKNIHKLNLNDYVAITYKLHGTSARYYNTIVKRNLNWKDKLAKYLGVQVKEYTYDYVSASRRVIKSVNFEELPNKNHYFNEHDLWSKVGQEFFEGRLYQGEAVYCEIIGKTYNGEAIQHGYTYGFDKPEVFIYRISNINPQGIEVDLPYLQMKERANQLGLNVCPELFYGKLSDFLTIFNKEYKEEVTEIQSLESTLNHIFYNTLLELPSILDNSVVEEGFCLRKDTYGKPEIFKIKSKLFLLHEGKQLDKEVVDIEENQILENA